VLTPPRPSYPNDTKHASVCSSPSPESLDAGGVKVDEQIRARLHLPHHRRALLEDSGTSPRVLLERGNGRAKR